MAWNEPGSGRQNPWRDPSDNKGSGQGKGPDVDAAARKLREFLRRLTGGNGGGFVMAIIGMLLAWFLLDSVVKVNANETGVVLRFGQFARLMPPGINLKLPAPFETVTKVDVGQIRQTNSKVRMLTRDENIVQVDFNVQYQIDDPRQYSFGVRDPDTTLTQAAESAVRTVVGSSTMDTILSGQRTELMAQSKKLLQETLVQYGTGIRLTELSFQNIRPPQEVKEAFDDANSALQDKQRAEEEAKAYSSKQIPEARGDAARARAAAEGDKSERIARAVGESQRFNLVHAQYKAAPEVTRKRLYLETMQEVVAPAQKVIDFGNGKNIINLPPAPGAQRVAPTTVVSAAEGKSP